jgi:hypothetical protein
MEPWKQRKGGLLMEDYELIEDILAELALNGDYLLD